MIRVLIVSTTEKRGGAALAAHRLMEALNGNGAEASMLVGERKTSDAHVAELPSPKRHRLHFLWERLTIFFHLRFQRERLFQIDIANAGTDITKLPAFREADVIHLHWINQGLLSLKGIRRIIDSGKPVVWTMHDLWPASSICHYARGCEHYLDICKSCPLLHPAVKDDSTPKNDLSTKVWHKKERMLALAVKDNRRMAFVACSQWLEGEARKSALLKGLTVTSIPNPIDVSLFHPIDKIQSRRALHLPEQGRIILFVSQRVTDERKGIQYLIDAVDEMARNQPSLKLNTHIAILGGEAEEVASRLAFPSHPLGYISDPATIAQVYNAADVFVTPSLEDNLPNTIMEAMACGVPCVGFRVGGIPEMISHRQTGYVATFADSHDLSKGLTWILSEANSEELSKASLKKVAACYSQASVAHRYMQLYEQLLSSQHSKP